MKIYHIVFAVCLCVLRTPQPLPAKVKCSDCVKELWNLVMEPSGR